MSSIAITMADVEHGVSTQSFTVDDKDMKRIFKALKAKYEDIDSASNIDGNRVDLTPNDVYKKLFFDMLSSIFNSAYEYEKLAAFKTLNIVPYKVQQNLG